MDLDNEFAELIQEIKELKSSLVVLQCSVQNKHKSITMENVEDNLEIILNLVNKTFDRANYIYDDITCN